MRPVICDKGKHCSSLQGWHLGGHQAPQRATPCLHSGLTSSQDLASKSQSLGRLRRCDMTPVLGRKLLSCCNLLAPQSRGAPYLVAKAALGILRWLGLSEGKQITSRSRTLVL